ncbi:MAG: GNAT family N-acetyltransferase [Polaribacter sp.]|jgi:ribosomal protein S18 acetylase RimI-like enzyme|nr:GNAT family N-acetyltransferase [Polaribacter sp.]
MNIKLVDKNEELYEILKVQTQNHIDHLSNASINKNGYVTVKHTYEMLEKMNSKARQVIATVNNEVVAYALVMLKEFKELNPILVPMFETFEKVEYKGKKLNELNYYVMGQICVRDDFKRRGIFKKLYEKHKEEYSKYYDFCLTEVSSNNIPSMIAHKKVGFETVYTFTDNTDEWNILLWEWK